MSRSSQVATTPAALRSRLALRDLLSEAVVGVVDRPVRSALTGLGTVLGVGTLITVLGLTSTAAAQISDQFDALRATEVHITDGRSGTHHDDVFPTDADARVRQLNGTTASGISWTPRATGTVSATPLDGDRGYDLPVVAATPGLFGASDARLEAGRTFDQFAQDRSQAVAVVGEGIAAQLGLPDLSLQPAIFIGGKPFTVIGTLHSADRIPSLLLSVVVPDSTAAQLWGPPTDQQSAVEMLVTTRVGAATQVAGEAALAVRPDQPESLAVTPPPDPHGLQTAVDDQLQLLLLVLGAISLVVGAVGIANTTLVAVMERTSEIGLRRAVGASGRHIAAQFLAESGMLGLLGGVLGTTTGLLVVVGTSVARDWTPVLPGWSVLTAPLAGLLIGVVAGLYPALRAARIEPVEALRR
jgi:putative ABC transport system permease protein